MRWTDDQRHRTLVFMKFTRPDARTWRCPPASTEARDFHAALPGYAPTPLTELPAPATELRVGRLFVKDESSRLGLPGFKALGASWAVHRVLKDQIGQTTLTTATDGNHGRAIARMARMFHQRAHIFVPHNVHPHAIGAIRAEQAGVTVVNGTYDDAVAMAAKADGILVQDMGRPGYEEIPAWIVEPDTAACVLTSLKADELTTVPTGDTIMAGLNRGTPSATAWPFLRKGLDVHSGPCGAGPRAVRDDLGALHTVVLISTEGSAAPPWGRAAARHDHRSPPMKSRRQSHETA